MHAKIQMGEKRMRVDVGQCTSCTHLDLISVVLPRCLLARDEARLDELVQLLAQGVVVRGAAQEVAQRLDEGGGLGSHPATAGAMGCKTVRPAREAATLWETLGVALSVVSPPLQLVVACVVGKVSVALPHLTDKGGA